MNLYVILMYFHYFIPIIYM